MMTEEIDPAAEFLAREQSVLKELDENFENKVNGVSNESLLVEKKENSSNASNFSTNTPSQPEPEKIRIWREEHQKLLKIKDENELTKKEDLKKQAKKELEDWYERYKQQLNKSKQNNRESSKNAEKEFIADRDAEGDKTENWDKISKMCEFNTKTARNLKDTSRLRSILLQLKQCPVNNGV